MKNLSSLDFHSLDRLKTQNPSKNVILAIFTSLVGIVGLILFATLLNNETLADIGLMMFALWIGLVLLFLVYKSFKVLIIYINNPKYLSDFAADNNLIFTKKDLESVEQRPGTIFHVVQANTKQIKNLFIGKTDEYNYSFFSYSYFIGLGNGARDYQAAVVEIELPQKVPHLVIDSTVESINMDIRSSVLPIRFSEDQRISLEGSFSRYFAIYSPDTQEINALSILTPDVMETIMQVASRCDIEMINNRLYFYWPSIPQTRDEYEKMFRTVDSIWSEIGKKLSKKATVAQSSSTSLSHTIQSNTYQLRPRSRPLFMEVVGGFLIFMVGFSYVGGMVLSRISSIPDEVLLGLFIRVFLAVVAIWIIFFGLKLYRQKKLLKELNKENK